MHQHHLVPRRCAFVAIAIAAVSACTAMWGAPLATADDGARHFELVSSEIAPGRDALAMYSDVSPDGNTLVISATLAQPQSVQGGRDASFVVRRTAAGWRAFDASLAASNDGPSQRNGSVVSLIPPGAEQLMVSARGQADPSAPLVDTTLERPFQMTPGETKGQSLIPSPFQEAVAFVFPGQKTLSSFFFGLSAFSSPAEAADGTRLTGGVIARRDARGLSVASRLPDGSVADFQNRTAVATQRSTYGYNSNPDKAVSDDGTRLFFNADEPNAPQDSDSFFTPLQPLYLRNGDATSAISRSKVDGEAKPARLMGISSDGDFSYFLTNETLDGDHGDGGIYRYQLSANVLTRLPTPMSGGTVDDLAITSPHVSRDGATLYFVSRKALAAGAQAGGANAYVWRGSDVRFIGDLGEGGEIWNASTDGDYAVMRSSAQLAGSATGGFSQVFRYSYETGKTVCASCRTDGSENLGPSGFDPLRSAAFDLPASAKPRAIANDGHVFFTAQDTLVEGDNGPAEDAYEFTGNELRLLSDGRGRSTVVDNSDDGSSVYVASYSPLTSDDKDGAFGDLFALRSGLDTSAPPAAGPCEGDLCQGAPAITPAAGLPASQRIGRNGNLAPPRPARPSILSRPTLSRSARRVLARSGTAPVRVRVRGAGTIRVRGTAVLGSRRRTVAAGSVAARKSAARVVEIPLRLNRLGRQLLKENGAVALRLEVRFSAKRSRATSITIRRITP